MADINISLDELVEATENSRELSDAQLENVVGGVIDPVAQGLIRNAIAMYKSGGNTLADALAQLPTLFDQLAKNPMYKRYVEQTNLDEVTEFVKANW